MFKRFTSIILVLLVQLLAVQPVLGPLIDVVKAASPATEESTTLSARDTCRQNAKAVLLDGADPATISGLYSDTASSDSTSASEDSGEDITGDESYDKTSDMPFAQVFDIAETRKMYAEGVTITQKDDNGAIFPPYISSSNNPIIDQINRNIRAVLEYNSSSVYIYTGMDSEGKTVENPANEYIVVCDSSVLIDQELFDSLLPTSLDYVDLLAIMADPNPKITFANRNDYYALLGEACANGFLKEEDQPASGAQKGNPCPSDPQYVFAKTADGNMAEPGSPENPNVTIRFNQDDDMNGNGLWDAPKVDYRVLQSLLYLVTPMELGGAGREHIRVKKLVSDTTSDELTTTVQPTTTGTGGSTDSGSNTSYLQVDGDNQVLADGLTPDEKNSDLKKYFGVEMVKAAEPTDSTAEEPAFYDPDLSTEPVVIPEEDNSITDAARQVKATQADVNESKHLIEGEPFRPTKVSTAVQIDEIDQARITTQIIKKRLMRNNSYEYKYQAPFPIKVAWQSQKGISTTPVPEYENMNMLGLARVNANIAVIQMLNAYGLGDLEINAADADVNSLGDAALLIGQSLFEQLLGSPNGSLKGWDLQSTLESIGLAYLEQELGLVRGALGSAEEDPIEEISYEDTVNNIGRVTLESVMKLPRGSLKSASGKSSEILETLGNRFLEKEVFQVSENTLKASTVVDKNGTKQQFTLNSVNDLLERLGEGRLEKVFGLPKQSTRTNTYEGLRGTSYKAGLLFPKQSDNPSDNDHDLSEWVSDQLQLSFVTVQKYQTNPDGSIKYDSNGKPIPLGTAAGANMYGFTEQDFGGTSSLLGGPLVQLQRSGTDEALKKFKRLIGSKVIENSVGIFQQTGASDRLSTDTNFSYPVGFVKSVIKADGTSDVIGCSADENRTDPANCKPRQKILPVQWTRDYDWCSDQARWRPDTGGILGGIFNNKISCTTSSAQGHDDDLLTQIYNLFNTDTLKFDYVFKQPDSSDATNKLPELNGDSTSAWSDYNKAMDAYYARNMIWTGDSPVNGVSPIQAKSSDGLMTDPANPTQRIPIPQLPIYSFKTFINNSALNGLIKDYGSDYMARYNMLLANLTSQQAASFFDLTKLTATDSTGASVPLSGTALDNALIARLNAIIQYPSTKEQNNNASFNGWLYLIKDLKARNSCLNRGGNYESSDNSDGKLISKCVTPEISPTSKSYDTNQEINGFNQINTALSNLEQQFTSFRDSLLGMLDSGGISNDNELGSGRGQSMMSAAIGLPGQAVQFDDNGRIIGTGLGDASYRSDPLRAVIAPDYDARGIVDVNAPVQDLARNIRNIGIQYLATRFTSDPLAQRTFLYQVTRDLNGTTSAINTLARATDSLFNLGLSSDMLTQRGLREGDFERIFKMDLGQDVFERIGKEELFRTIWNRTNAADKIKNSNGYSALNNSLDAATQDIKFYYHKIDLLQSQIDKLDSDYQEISAQNDTYSKAISHFMTDLKAVNSTQANGTSTKLGARLSNNFKYIQQAIREVEPTAKKMQDTIRSCKAESPTRCPVTKLEKDVSDIQHTLQEIAAGRDLPDKTWSTRSTGSTNRNTAQNHSNTSACFNIDEAKDVLLKGKGAPPTTTIDIKAGINSIANIQDLLVDYAGYVGSCNLDKGLMLPKGSIFIWYKLGSERYVPNPYLERQDAIKEADEIQKQFNALTAEVMSLTSVSKSDCDTKGQVGCDFSLNINQQATYARKLAALTKRLEYVNKALANEGNEGIRWNDMQGGGAESGDSGGGIASSSDPAAGTLNNTNTESNSNVVDILSFKSSGDWLSKVFVSEDLNTYMENGYNKDADIKEQYRHLMWGKNSWNADNFALAIGMASAMSRGQLKIADVELYYLLDPDQLNSLKDIGERRMRGALTLYLAKGLMPQLGGMMQKYQLTSDDLIALLQGNTRPITEKIGGKIIDNALGLTPGTGAQLLYPPCRAAPTEGQHLGPLGPCNRDPENPMSDPDNIRLQLLAQEGFSKLGLELPNFPGTFDMTAGGNMLENLGNAGIAESLGLVQNSFDGSFNDPNSAIRLQKTSSQGGEPGSEDYYINNFDIIYPKLMRAFGLSETPFSRQATAILKSTEQLISKDYSAQVDSADAYTVAAGKLFQAYRKSIEEFYRKNLIERLYTKEEYVSGSNTLTDYLYWKSSADFPFTARDKATTIVADDSWDFFNTVTPTLWTALNTFIAETGAVKVMAGDSADNKREELVKKLRTLVLSSSGQLDVAKRSATYNETFEQLLTSDSNSTLLLDANGAGDRENKLFNWTQFYLGVDAPGPNLYLAYINRLNDREHLLDQQFNLDNDIFKLFLQGSLSADRIATTAANKYYLTDVLGSAADEWIDTQGPEWLKDVNEGLKILTKGQYDLSHSDTRNMPYWSGNDTCADGMGIGEMLSSSIFSTAGSNSDSLCGLKNIDADSVLYSKEQKAFRIFFFDTVMARTFSADLEDKWGLEKGTFKNIVANPKMGPQILLGQAVGKVADQLFGDRQFNAACGLDQKMCFQNNLRGLLREAFLAGYYDPNYVDPADPSYRGRYTTSFNGDRSLKKLKELSRKWLDGEMRRMGRKYLGVELTTNDVDLFVRGDGRFYSLVALQYSVNTLNDSLDRNPETRNHPNKHKFKISYQDVRGTVGISVPSQADYRKIDAQSDYNYDVRACGDKKLSECDARSTAINQFMDQVNNGNQDPTQNATLAIALAMADTDKDGTLSTTENELLTRDNGALVGQYIDKEKEAQRQIARDALSTKMNKDSENNFRYKALDLGAFQLDHNIPVNFTQRIFEGDAMDRSAALGGYLFNSWADNDQEFKDFCSRYNIAPEKIGTFVGELLAATFERDPMARANALSEISAEFFTGGLATSLDKAFSDWVSKQLFDGKEVPTGMLTGLIGWLVGTGGDWDKFNSDVCVVGSGDNCTKVPALGSVLVSFGRQKFESWIDKQCGWTPGTAALVSQSLVAMYKLYQVMNADLNSLNYVITSTEGSKVVAGSTLSDAQLGKEDYIRKNTQEYKKAAGEVYQVLKALIMVMGQKTFAKIDSQLGLPAGMTSQLVALGLDIIAANMGIISIGPLGWGIAIAGILCTAIWGVTKVVINTQGTTDGYYPYYKYGKSGMVGNSTPWTPPFPETMTQDDLTGLFDPTKPKEYTQGLMNGARAKVLGLLRDFAGMPGSRWAIDHKMDPKEFRVSQLFTYGDDEYSPLSNASIQSMLREPTPWDKNPSIGYGNYAADGCYDLVNGILERDAYSYEDPDTGEIIDVPAQYKTACLNYQNPEFGFFSTDKFVDAIYIAW